MNDYTEVMANFVIVLRGDILALRQITAGLDILLRNQPNVKVVHQMTSASKLWIKEGGELDIRFLLNDVYGGTPTNRMWMLTFFKRYLEANGNRIVSKMELEWPKNERTTVDWLDEDEEPMVWSALINMANPLEGAILAMELGLGCRRIEIMRQKASEIETRTVTVLRKGRNGGKTRTILLSDTVKEFVARWMYERELMVERFKRQYPSQTVPDLLFIHEWLGELRGYSESGIDRIVWAFKKRMENAFARTFDFSNHTMRRTFGRRQWQLGTPIETISEMLGHESIDMTKKYLGLNLSDQEDPMKAQDRFIATVVQDSALSGHFRTNASVKWWAQRDLDS